MAEDRKSLLELAELDDPELVPEILPSTATLAVKGDVTKLRTLFHRAAAVTPQQSIVPGTQYALFEAFAATSVHGAYVRVTATDGELTTSVVADGVEVVAPGSVLVSPKAVVDRLRLSPTTVVSFTVVDSAMLLRAGRARWTMQVPIGVDDSVRTLLRSMPEVAQHAVSVEPFLHALKAARLAASTTNARTSLMQVSVQAGTITGCDGGRLHKAPVPFLDPVVNLTIPVRVCDELIKALEYTEEEKLWLGGDDSRLLFTLGDDTIVGQRLLLPFPDLQNLLLAPSLGNTHRLVVERDDLAVAIRRVRVSADPDYATITLALVPAGAGWVIELRARDLSGNAATETVDCQWDGKSRDVAFNHKHLSDLLGVCIPGPIVLRLGTDTKSTRHPLLVESGGSTLLLAQVVGR